MRRVLPLLLAAAALLSAAVPAQARLPIVPVTFTDDVGACGGLDACAWVNPGGPPTIAVRRSLRGSQRRYVIAHERGHAFDYVAMGSSDTYAMTPARDTIMAILGLRGPWRSTDGNSPHEQFAEAFAICGTYSRPPTFQGVATRNEVRVVGGYGYMPSPRTHSRVCAAIRRQAARAGVQR